LKSNQAQHITITMTSDNSLTLLPGKINLSVPLAIGTLQWGTTWVDDKLINSRGCISESVAKEIVASVSSENVTLFDTAEGYGGGTSEKRLGRLMGPNHVAMTKFLPVGWKFFHYQLEQAARESCRRLQVKSIPVYLLHSPVHWREIEYWVEACAKAHKKGLIDSMGLSNCNADQVRRAVNAGKRYGVPVVCNQVHYSLLDFNSKALQEMEKVCRELDVKIIAFSPIGQGLLTDGMTAEKWETNKPAKMLRLTPRDLESLRGVLKSMAQKYEKTMAQVALNWCIQHKVIPLVGCRTTQQAQDSMGCLGWSLSKVDVEQLDRVALDKSTLESKSLLSL
jgi:pyridoxine 4-dehydrogenase